MNFLRKITATLEMIKWEHSIFALTGAMLAERGWPRPRQLVLIGR